MLTFHSLIIEPIYYRLLLTNTLGNVTILFNFHIPTFIICYHSRTDSMFLVLLLHFDVEIKCSNCIDIMILKCCSMFVYCRPSGVVRWHSFQRASSVQRESYKGRCVSSLSSGQILVLRKLALLKLTSLMERHCPTHRSGWNWELPKFMRKIKTPDYKGKL